jgi:endonuclease/exonuclease/phosphatase family metal-dependent hydrolase
MTAPSDAHGASGSDPEAFTLVTWNTFGAAQGPLALFRGRGAAASHRFEHPELLPALEGLDVVCMQELWLAEAVETFTRVPGLHHRIVAKNHATLWPLTIGGSGLGIASRHPIVTSEMRDFSRPHVGAERFARKGMAHARIRIGSREIDVVTTHMQAGYDDGAKRVRRRHLAELRAFADEHGSPDRPLVVCGDLNIDGLGHVRAHEYTSILETFADYTDIFEDHDLPTFHTVENTLARRYEPNSPAQRIDYVLVRSSGSSLVVRHKDLLFRAPLAERDDLETVHASDHYGLRVKLGFV